MADPAPVDVGAMRAEIAHARDVLAAGALSWDDAEKLCDALDASQARVVELEAQATRRIAQKIEVMYLLDAANATIAALNKKGE